MSKIIEIEEAKETKKVSLEQLIKKKLDKDSKKTAKKEIYIESLDGNMTFNNPSDSMRIEYSEKVKSGSYVDMIDAMVKMIFDCCPQLRSKELQESCDIDYPRDIVRAIFEINEITDIGVQLLNFFEDKKDDEESDETEDKLKN